MNRLRWFGAIATTGLVLLMALASSTGAAAAGPKALLVGPPGTFGAKYTSIQDAVNHANPGDWVLVAPGVYHEHGGPDAGVLIQKPGVHVRGMNRNQVIVDGTRFSATKRS